MISENANRTTCNFRKLKQVVIILVKYVLNELDLYCNHFEYFKTKYGNFKSFCCFSPTYVPVKR